MGSPGASSRAVSTEPLTDSVMNSVCRSGPPNATLVVEVPAQVRSTTSGSARWFSTHTTPSPGLATMTRPALSTASPSGPLGPWDVKNALTLDTLPSSSSGTRHTWLPRVTPRYSTRSSGDRATPLGLGTFDSNKSNWPLRWSL